MSSPILDTYFQYSFHSAILIKGETGYLPNMHPLIVVIYTSVGLSCPGHQKVAEGKTFLAMIIEILLLLFDQCCGSQPGNSFCSDLFCLPKDYENVQPPIIEDGIPLKIKNI